MISKQHHKPSRFMAALDTGAHVLEQGVRWAGVAQSLYNTGKMIAPLLAAL